MADEKARQLNLDAATDRQVHHLPFYRVLLHNDDVNHTRYVVTVLQEVFHLNQHEAETGMLEAHRTGVVLCVIEPLERAEFHAGQLTSARLTATIEAEVSWLPVPLASFALTPQLVLLAPSLPVPLASFALTPQVVLLVPSLPVPLASVASAPWMVLLASLLPVPAQPSTEPEPGPSRKRPRRESSPTLRQLRQSFFSSSPPSQ